MKGLVFVSEKTRVRLKIVGSEFVVSADEDKDYIVKISNMVDEQIKELLRQGDSLNVSMAAILAALNYCDELEKEKIITAELLKRTETSESVANKCLDELEYLRIENKRLKEEKLGLHKLIDELQSGADVKPQQSEEEKAEELPQRLTFPIDNSADNASAASAQPQQAEAAQIEQPQAVEKNEAAKANEAPKQEAQDELKQQPEREQENEQAAKPAAPIMTARQMLEEKRNALLAQQRSNAQKNGAKNSDRPKPFRPVSSAKSGGGAFRGNGKSEPKINYRDNDKISESYRRSDFADLPQEEETITFFDRR